MNGINIICPHCGREYIIEDYLMDDDTLECAFCKELIHEEPETDTCPACFKDAVIMATGVCRPCEIDCFE